MGIQKPREKNACIKIIVFRFGKKKSFPACCHFILLQICLINVVCHSAYQIAAPQLLRAYHFTHFHRTLPWWRDGSWILEEMSRTILRSINTPRCAPSILMRTHSILAISDSHSKENGDENSSCFGLHLDRWSSSQVLPGCKKKPWGLDPPFSHLSKLLDKQATSLALGQSAYQGRVLSVTLRVHLFWWARTQQISWPTKS